MRKFTIPVIAACKKQTSGLPALLIVPMLCGCSGIQSTLEPHGPQARAIGFISWIMFWGAASILLLVMVLALYATYRAPEKRRPLSVNTLIAGGGVVLPVVTLTALLIYGVYAMAGLRAQPPVDVDAAVRIEVVGNRWWWDVHYRDAGGVVATANEIRIPAGVPVAVAVRTNDVIHSFWVPNLAGKIDLIPGRVNHVVLQADKPGVFRGQCAEYCGAQHARMALFVVAETADAYAVWLERQRLPAAVPADTAAVRGREAFIAHDCIACHTVRGVGRARERGPDLTHVGSRLSLAAGILENNHANLADFIARSQTLKPANGMPSYPHIDRETLHALATYMESLR